MRCLRPPLLLLVLALAGCSPFAERPASQPQRIYLLEGAEAMPALQDAPGCHVLMVNSPRAAPGFAGAGFAYRQGDARIRYFAFHRWAESPARMFHLLLVTAAERSNVFRGVLTPAAPVAGDVRLDSEILDLSQRFAGDAAAVHFAVRVRLFGDGALLGSKVFETAEPAQANPQSGVEAANRASGRVLEQVMGYVQALLQQESPPCASATLLGLSTMEAALARASQAR